MAGSPYGGPAVAQSGGYDGMSGVQRANAASLQSAGAAPPGGPEAKPSQEEYQRQEELKHAKLSGYLAGKLGDDPEKLEAKGASAGKEAHNAIKVAVSHAWNWLKTGRADGTAINAGPFPGRKVDQGASGDVASGQMMGPPDMRGGFAGGNGPSELAAFKQADAAAGGRKSDADGPEADGDEGGSSKSRKGGRSTTKSSPSKTTGPAEVTAAPRSSDPNDSDATMKEMRGLLDKYKDGSQDQVDLSPLMALSDSWSGGKLLHGYERPMNQADREKLRLHLTEQMAKRQSDLEWHREKIGMNDAAIAGRQGVADTKLVGTEYATDHKKFRPAGPGKAPKVPAGGIDPDEKALGSHYDGQIEGVIRNNYRGDPRGLRAAKAEMRGKVWQGTQQVVAGAARDPQLQQQYPGLASPDEATRKAEIKRVYGDVVGDMAHHRPELTGMKPRSMHDDGQDGGGEGGD